MIVKMKFLSITGPRADIDRMTMEYHRAESSGTLQKWKNQGSHEAGTQLADSSRCV